MKSPKRIVALLLAGFLAFAPPGTLIFLFALLVGLLGRRWGVAAAAVLCLGACAALLLWLRRRRRARPRPEESARPESRQDR